MATAAPASAALGVPAYSSDLSHLVLEATPAVQFVMIVLVLASILSWATLFIKLREFAVGRRRLRHSEACLQQATGRPEVADLDGGHSAVSVMIAAAEDEWARSEPLLRAGRVEGLKERIAARVQGVESDYGDSAAQGLGILATVSAVTPFVGLFGTVWGIMHSFIGIAASNATSLAVVAPGIAEALLATGLGLAAAIPATLMYNALGRQLGAYRARLARCATHLMCLISRDLDGAQLATDNGLVPPLTTVRPARVGVATGH